ncbi:ribonuclease H-like domain-containing protein [Lewinella sp. JB7]|uniref:ribonuclease H-like domain-containing protein n=1 Tax=Lewinella sp. JB7 TaxID=2962887 RepID=UPI0020C9DC57|nr:ribonuclease H-like domain-containing protein [Lewinella sp. JB7]MCP9234591.1 ribonuclease H-like domain-containing protein [Lewinella sp. JB7]
MPNLTHMVEQIDVTRVLFLDIETVSGEPSYARLDDTFRKLWAHKAPGALKRYGEELTEEELVASYTEKAGIFAEFGKIVCISVGAVYRDKDKQLKIRLKSFADRDEAKLLTEFSEMLDQYYGDPGKYFICGHNIKEFDVPYMCRRMVTHQQKLPAMLDISGKKPWETKHLVDTMELWKFGDRKAYVSLKLLAAVLGFPSPKDDIDGADVGRVFWEEDDVERIAVYCEKDVLATAQLFLRYQRKPLFAEEQVCYVER